jgi:hypothetical protein
VPCYRQVTALGSDEQQGLYSNFRPGACPISFSLDFILEDTDSGCLTFSDPRQVG